MLEPRISALIVARNEEANLPGCLDSLRWVDELIVVVDAASQDRTEAIAREAGARLHLRPFDNFASQRNAGLEQVRGDWVLAIDSDERVTPDLRAEIQMTVRSAAPDQVGYRLPIQSDILGRRFRFSGTQHDRPLRLFRPQSGHWTGEVHETVAIQGQVGQLRNPLQHCTLPDMQSFLQKLDSYTSLEAARMLREGIRSRLFDLTLRPAWTFAKLYGLKQGFRDGPEGFVFCALSAVSVAVRQWKLRELERNRGRTASTFARTRAARAVIGGAR